MQDAGAIVIEAPSPWQLTWQDLKGGLQNWRIWILLSWQDIRLRYRRSQLGPFWLTISMAITIYSMGFLYGHLFRMKISNYFPFLAAGMLTWNLIALLITEGTNAFIEAGNFLKQMKLPYSVFLLRIIARSLIVFAHNIIVIVPLYFIFHIPFTPAFLMVIPGLFLIALSAFFYGIILAMVGARFRDVGQLIVSVIQVIFFVTPIMWSPSVLPEQYQRLIWLNPFSHYVEILRAPLISTMPELSSLLAVIGLTLLGALLACHLLVRSRHRIVYWL